MVRRPGVLIARLFAAAMSLALWSASTTRAQSVLDPNASASVLQGSFGGQQQQNGNTTGNQNSPYGGALSSGISPGAIPSYNPVQLPASSARNSGDFADRSTSATAAVERVAPPPLSEFETYVSARAGRPLTRFGSTLLINGAAAFATPPTTAVPPDYRLNAGDELLVGITGSVNADLKLVIDNEGRVFIPNVGEVNVAGIRYGDLAAAISRRMAEQYKQAKVSVVIGHLHGLTVYVTGFAVTPGAYTVSSLSTMVDAVLAAGGPAAGGSFRSVELRRNGQLVTTLDLYDLLLKGDKSHDAILQNQDVLNIQPVGPELAITGSVNSEAIFEAKPGETLGDLIRFAGGFNSLADTSRVLISGLSDLDAAGSRQLEAAAVDRFPAERGTIVRVLSLANVARPLERQAILATIEGEVDHPGRYYLKPGSTLADLLGQSGGLTGGAFVYGSAFFRETVRQQQQASFDRAVADLQLTAAAAPLTGLNSIASGGAAAAGARSQAALAIIDRLKDRKPDGRLVLSLAPNATQLPGGLTLENNDRIYVPPRPVTVGVFGAVYQAGSFLFTPSSRIGDYLRMAGGPQRIADRGDIFVVRANGSVLSIHQVHGLAHQPALPGDVIFVPIHTGPSLFEKIVAVSQIISQFGINILTLHAVGVF